MKILSLKNFPLYGMSLYSLHPVLSVKKRIMDLFRAQCEFEQTDIADVTYFDFESGAAWPRWSGVTPTIVEYEQYCGLNSTMVRLMCKHGLLVPSHLYS